MTAKNPITIETFNRVAPHLPANIAVLMRGPTGVGKSFLAKQVAEHHDLPFIDVRAPQCPKVTLVVTPTSKV